MSRPVLVRPLRETDLPAVTAFPLVAHLLRTDPGGCWVAEDGEGLVGFAASARRELLWVLSTYSTAQDGRGDAALDPLLAATAEHGRGCLRGALLLGTDGGAARRARAAGFTLHPTMSLQGYVDRSALPVVERVRPGVAGDRDLLDSVDRQVRDAAHGPDHDHLLERHRLWVVDRPTGSGYVYLASGGGPVLLSATNRRTATDLLWEALAAAPTDRPIRVTHVTPANEWAVDVGLAAGLELVLDGYLGLRGMKPPSPYLPHSALF